MTPVDHAADPLLRHIDASPSPYHAAENAAATLTGAGFRRVAQDEPLAGVDAGVVVEGGSVVAWSLPAGAAPDDPFVVVGAHTDSPNLRIKPRPDTGRAGWRQLGVEVYGGVLLNSWLDRDLGLSGRVAVRDGGGASLRLVHLDRPLLRVPQLAIHLDREVNEKGLVLDRQTELTPVWGLGRPTDGELAELVADELGVAPGEILAFDLMVHDLTPGARLGREGELLAAPRLDNLCSCWCAVEALLRAHGSTGGPGRVVVLFDHEEIGSQSTTGAGSPQLRSHLERLVAARGGSREDLHRAVRRSLVVSADMAHAAHPNYLDRMEPDHHVLPNGGPVLKTNANVRYASDAATTARFVLACEAAGVPHQVYVHRTNLACGSTIGPITAANLGAPVVDVGLAQLSMHSARELAGAEDPAMMVALMAALFEGAGA